MKRAIPFLMLFQIYSGCLFGQTSGLSAFESVNSMLRDRNYFKANEIYQLSKGRLTTFENAYIGALLHNAFNRNEQSNESIQKAIKAIGPSSDSLKSQLYKTKADNEVKLFQYAQAKTTTSLVLEKYSHTLSETEKSDLQNDLVIWKALVNVPKQNVRIKNPVTMHMKRDKAGLRNIPIHISEDQVDFIFDTGANFSTVTESTAKSLNMEILPVVFNVGTITGEEVVATVGICPKFFIGKIEIDNAVFIVLKDEYLSFPQIEYQINGILGYPVIAALQEIQMTQDDEFIVVKRPHNNRMQANLAMDGLTPLLYLDGRHFSFDTGANNTVLYKKFYDQNKVQIDSTYQVTELSFAGAAGQKTFKGFVIKHTFNFFGKAITLDDVQLLAEKIKSEETVYGNIGQDFIRKFHKMIINFKYMYLAFE